MDRKSLIQNDGYWQGTIEILCFNYKGKKLEKELIKSILNMKTELINSLNEETVKQKEFCENCGSDVTDKWHIKICKECTTKLRNAK